MSEKHRLACEVAVAFALAMSAGCSATPGEICAVTMTECAGGLTCDRWVDGEGIPYRCLEGCERRRDCSDGAACLGAAYFERVSTRGVCDSWGNLGAGERCEVLPEDLCGPGLVCSSLAGLTCVSACDATSPHSEDRVCPEGRVCYEGVSSGIDGQRACLQRCDLATRDGCPQFTACLQIQHPQEGLIGVCMPSYVYSCETCPGDQVCADGMCFDPLDAPPLPWIVSPDVPPLVD